MPSRLVSRVALRGIIEEEDAQLRITEEAVSELADAVESYARDAVRDALLARDEHIAARRLQGVNHFEPELRGRHVLAGLAKGGVKDGPPER